MSVTIQSGVPASSGSSGQPIPTSSTFDIGTLLFGRNTTAGGITNGSTITGSSLATVSLPNGGTIASGGTQSGTWTNRTGITVNASAGGMFSRTA